MSARDALLTLNVGSSSIKFAVYDAADGDGAFLRGAVERVGSNARLKVTPENAAPAFGSVAPDATLSELLEQVVDRAETAAGVALIAVGHRVVHGGRHYAAPVRIDAQVLEGLLALEPLAPNHQPANLAGIAAVSTVRPAVLQAACFDTAFHRTQPRLAQLFALPRRFADAGVLRYGFHGLSYQHIADVLPAHLGARAEGRVIVAHLGHGASLCAMRGRRSVATSMGFTALDGLMMGKRCGTIDPGVILHLARAEGLSFEAIDHLLHNESGLLGVSGVSNDMRDLAASDDPRAKEAVQLFIRRAVEHIGQLTAVLGGLDALVFTAGIGEHSPPVRAGVIDHFAFLGAELDAAANEANAPCISTPDSAVAMRVIPTDEEGVIARSTRTLLHAEAATEAIR